MIQGTPRGAFDSILRHGTLFDGTGAPAYTADLGIEGERIAAIGDLGDAAAALEIEARGLCMAPGFIDVHTHDDRLLLDAPDMTPKVTQGVTTVVVGNCGISLAPLTLDQPPPPPLDLLGREEDYRFARIPDYLEALERKPAATNAAVLVGHSTLRVACMDDVYRPARGPEIDAMRALLREALDAGVLGLSSGLFYPTGSSAPADELVALAEVMAGTGALYTTHMRDEADGVEDSLEETFDTARRAKVPVVISHHKCVGERNFGRSRATLARIERARREQPVFLDAYPYVAGSTVLLPEFADRASRIMVSWSQPHPEMAGRDLQEIADGWNCDRDAAIRRLSPAGGIYFMMDEADVRRILAYPHTMFGSDGLPHDTRPHPRLWGAFPRILGHYARDLGLFSLETAIHRMTGLSASNFGLTDRGLLRPGAYADIVLFDRHSIIDKATYEAPCLPAAGIDTVIVNGRPVLRQGQPTGERPGHVLRRNPADDSRD